MSNIIIIEVSLTQVLQILLIRAGSKDHIISPLCING